MQVASLVSGVQKGLALGEAPVTLVAPNLQVMVASALVSETGNSVLTTPPTDKQAAYGSLQPRITLGPQGLSSCTSSPWSNYAEYSLVQWGVNPYATSEPIQSTLMRFSSVSPAYVPPSAMTTRNVQRKSISIAVNGVPAYTIALQFSTVQEFNFSASADYTARSRSTPNFTLPACTLYDGSKYVPCKGCNISSYTNYNVTYSCFDIEQLCPSTSTRRRLKDGTDTQHALEGVVSGRHSDVDNVDVDVDVHEEEDEEEEDEEEEEEDEEEDEADGIMDGHERMLKETSSKPAPASDDDSVPDNIASTSATFGVLLQSVNAQLSTVLSSNPFTVKAKENTAVLTLVGCLSGGMLLMLVFLRRLDNQQNITSKYVKKEKEALRKKSFEKVNHKEATSDLEVLHKRREEFQRSQSTMNMLGNIRHNSLSQKYLSSSFSTKRTSSKCSSQMNTSFLSMILGPKEGDKVGLLGRSDADDDLDIDEVESNDDDEDEDSQGMTVDSCYSDDKHQATSAVVEEFLHKVFSGRSIFKKDWNAWRIIHANHSYLKTIGTPTIGSSRVIRFLGLMAQIMIILLLDTIFFGIFYPISAPCTFTTDEVSTDLKY
jgi:hypothetical protein